MTPEELIKLWRERAATLTKYKEIVIEPVQTDMKIYVLRECADELEAALKEGEQDG